MDKNLEARLKELSSKSCSAADLSLSSNPNLQAERASREFIMMLKDLSTLMNDVTVVDRADCRGEIPRFDSCGIAAAGACSTTCVPGSKLEDTYITYDMVKYKVGHTVDEDMLDCNKLGRRLNDIAMQALMIKIKNNMEFAAIMGDEDLPMGDGQSDYNNLMGPNDGWLKLALASVPTTQVIDAAGAGPSYALFSAAQKLLPPRYRQNRASYRFVGGPSLNDWWVDDWANRLTAAGDLARESGVGGRIRGATFYEVPQWPENLPFGVGDEVTHILYTPLANLMLFIRRKIEIETERRIECDDYLSVGWFSQDVAIAEPEAVVLIKNVAMCDGTPWAECRKAGMDVCALTPHDLD